MKPWTQADIDALAAKGFEKIGNVIQPIEKPVSKTVHPLQGVKESKQRKPPRHLESELQILCISWFDRTFPQHVMHRMKIDNEFKGSKYVGDIKRQEGKLPGAHDLFFSIPIGMYSGLFLEMKSDLSKKLSPAQELFKIAQEEQGYKCVLIGSFEAFCFEVKKYLEQL